MIKRIHHVAVVVDDIEGALSFWQDALGLKVSHQAEVPEQQAQVAFLPVGEAEVELVKPTTDTSGMAKYLAKRGPGIHHVCVEVDNLAEMLADRPNGAQRRGREEICLYPPRKYPRRVS
jgi:methylmalonyl-CoA/ethylmalonyl-CoA epimerase